MDFKGFAKVHEDKDKAIMRHPKGHEIVIAKKGLSPKLKKHLSALPLQMADAGEVPDPNGEPMGALQGAEAGSQTTEAAPQQQGSSEQIDMGSAPMQPNGQPQPDQSFSAQNIPGFKEAQQAINLGQSIEQHAVQGQADAIKMHMAATQDANAEFQKHTQSLMNQIKDVTEDIREGHIEPNQYVDNLSDRKKVGFAIGMILGGIGSGLTHQENPAMKYLNDQINRDVEAQKAKLGQAHTLLSALQHQFGDSISAENMTRAVLANNYADQLTLAAKQDGGMKAQQNALKAHSDLMQKYMPLVQQAAARTMVQGAQQGQPGQPQQGQPTQQDPASLVPYLVDPMTGKPPSDQIKEKISDEVGKAQNASENEKAMLEAFDRASKENTVLKTGAGLLRTPESVQALNNFVLPMIKDQEGRVNEFEQKTAASLMPQPGDMDSKIAAKRKDFQQWIEGKKAAPLAKAYGLDLQKFQSTKRPEPSAEIKSMNGVQYRKVPGGWQKV